VRPAPVDNPYMKPLGPLEGTPELLQQLEPALRRLDGDSNIRGSVALHVEDLLQRLPPGCALTGATIEEMALSPEQEAYLVVEQWRRSHPTVFAKVGQENLAKTLESLVAEAGQRYSDIWPYWLDSIGTVVPVAGARSGEAVLLEVGRWGAQTIERQLELVDFGLIPTGSCGLSRSYVRVNFRSRTLGVPAPSQAAADVDVLFWEHRSPAGSSEWRVSDNVTLEHIPSNLLQALRTFVSMRYLEERSSDHLDECARRFKAAVNAEHQRRLGMSEAAVDDIIEKWRCGESQVGKLDHDALNAASLMLKAPSSGVGR
jgi:hypothetical protein